MNNFKKGDIVVYTGQRFINAGAKCSIEAMIGAKGVVVMMNGEKVVVNWYKRNSQPALSCYFDNLEFSEPENEINKALDVLKKHGTVEFTPITSPWEGQGSTIMKRFTLANGDVLLRPLEYVGAVHEDEFGWYRFNIITSAGQKLHYRTRWKMEAERERDRLLSFSWE